MKNILNDVTFKLRKACFTNYILLFINVLYIICTYYYAHTII